MQNLSKDPKIQQISTKIVNTTLLMGVILGLITFLLSFFLYSAATFKLSFLINFIVLLLLFGIWLFRKKLPIQIKSIVIILGLFLIYIADVLNIGLYAGAKAFIIIIPFYSFMVYSLRKTAFILLLIIVSFLLLAYLFVFSTYQPSIDLNESARDITRWLINLLIICIVSFVVVSIVYRFNQVYLSLIRDLESSNKTISEKERNYREIFNSSTDAIFIHDLDGKILDVNASMLEMYGYNLEDIAHITISELSSQNEKYTTNDAVQFVLKAVNGEPQVFDWQAKKKDGDFFWVEVALKKTVIGESERILAIIRDITEKKEDSMQLALYQEHLKDLVFQKTEELQQTNFELLAVNDNLAHQKEELLTTLNELQRTQNQLFQSEKMASLGILAAGVAHEINNPLNFIQGSLYGLETYFEEKLTNHVEEIRPLLNGIEVGIKRASDIVASLNHYSRSDTSKIEIIDIHAIIDNCLLILNNQIKNKAVVQKDYTQSNFKFIGNEGRLHQVFLNILTNSIQAIKDNGLITICTFIENEILTVSIKDNGGGISAENMSKILDPFFTTKEVGQGTGLGMSISSRIIKDHHGTIEYHSEINKGALVIVSFPISKK